MIDGKILIIDDDREILESLELLLKHEFSEVVTLSNPNMIPEHVRKSSYDIILLDMNFSAGVNTGNEGIFWMEKILGIDPLARVIMITAYGDVDLAVKALKLGASDFIQKPWNADKLIHDIRSVLELKRTKDKAIKLEKDNQTLKAEFQKQYPEFIGDSPAIKAVFSNIEKVAATDANVLILGENGTGKELVARQLHKLSGRRNENMIRVDLASLPPTLFESEIFGHIKGSFTDAREDRTGRFEAANGGSLFLDEIGNLPISLQSKLLTSLETREITRVGSVRTIPVDIRLISATNKDLFKLVEEQLFRQDLLYRLNTVQIELPPLRERGNDILLLTEYFIQRFAIRYDKPGIRIGQRAIEYLNSHTWPGNVRELQHTIENAIIMCEANIISPGDLNIRVPGPSDDESLDLESVEKNTIAKALIKHHGKFSSACNELGISRTTLYHKIKKYDL